MNCRGRQPRAKTTPYATAADSGHDGGLDEDRTFRLRAFDLRFLVGGGEAAVRDGVVVPHANALGHVDAGVAMKCLARFFSSSNQQGSRSQHEASCLLNADLHGLLRRVYHRDRPDCDRPGPRTDFLWGFHEALVAARLDFVVVVAAVVETGGDDLAPVVGLHPDRHGLRLRANAADGRYYYRRPRQQSRFFSTPLQDDRTFAC